MGSAPIFQNPYGHNGNSPSQIDQVIGTSYEVVREVAENLEYIKHVSAHLPEIFRISGSTDAIDLLATYLEELGILLEHIEEVLVVAASIDELMVIHDEMTKLLTIADNITQLADLYANLDEILTKGGTVIVSDVPPVTDVSGKLWWETDSGNLYTWYDDGTSGQWVQVNIASTSYSWTDILDKPSTFPPANHVHAENVKKTGDTMTGNLLIAPATGHAQVTLRSVGSTVNGLFGQMVNAQGAASNRWSIFLGNTLAESGTLTGSDFIINRYTNTGAIVDVPFQIPRATGVPHFVNGLTSKTPLASDNGTSVATTAFVKGQINSFSEILGNTLKMAGKTVIHVVDDPELKGYSAAWGDGLLKTVHKPGSSEGKYNVSLGFSSLFELTTGSYNTMGGHQSGQKITTGGFNTGFGRAALAHLTTGAQNSGFGQGALVGSSEAGQLGKWFNNTGVGYNALYDLKDTAANNTGVGWGVMTNTGVTDGLSGQNNSAFGVNALHNITSGDNNEAFGYLALGTVTTGNNNIAIGYNAGSGITTGSGNVIIGHNMGTLAPGLANSLIISVENGTQLITGNKTGVFMLGTQGATVPLAGYVGEYREVNLPISSDKTMTTAVAMTVCSLSLSPGDWDVYGWVGYTGGADTKITRLISGLSLVSNDLDMTTPGTTTSHTQVATLIGANANYMKGMSGYRRMSINVSDIVYLTAYASFTGGAMSCYGKIWARRMR